MVDFLLNKFLKAHTRNDRMKLKAAVGLISAVFGICANTLLSAFKFTVGFLSGSAAVISDGANNLSDVAASVISLIGFRLAAKPADEEHPFGHGRVEYILSLIISFFIMLMGAELLKNSISKIIHPRPIQYSVFFIIVLSASVLVKLLMALFNASLHKKADLPALKAVVKDSLSDCICTLAVLVSFLLFRFFGINVDAYIGAAVSLLVLWSGVGVLKESIQPLIGKPAQKHTAEELAAFIVGFDEKIVGVHDIMLHDYGMGKVFAVAHAEMPGDISLSEIHTVIDKLEKAAEEAFSIQLVLHADPVETDNHDLYHLRENVVQIVKSVDEHYTIHDFRLSEDGSQMFFDLVIDSDIKKDSEKIGSMVAGKITAVLGEIPRPVIHVEFSFSQR